MKEFQYEMRCEFSVDDGVRWRGYSWHVEAQTDELPSARKAAWTMKSLLESVYGTYCRVRKSVVRRGDWRSSHVHAEELPEGERPRPGFWCLHCERAWYGVDLDSEGQLRCTDEACDGGGDDIFAIKGHFENGESVVMYSERFDELRAPLA